jgi:peptidoglycan/LPS O-acetylase OafA/YrhL
MGQAPSQAVRIDRMPPTLVRTADGRMPYFPALDGVRAYCILLVMYDHLKSGGHGAGWVNGHLGVDLFFILSGFLITTLLRREQYFSGQIDLRAFYWRRFFRIIPVYLVVLAIYVAVCHLPAQGEKWTQLRGGLPYFLTMMNEFAREPGNGTVFTHTWSLGVEEKFYLVWPLLFFLVARTLRVRMWVMLGLFALAGIAAILGHGYLAQAYFGLLTGCLMAVVLSGQYGDRVLAAAGRVPASIVLSVFFLGFYAEHVSKALIIVFSCTSVIFLTFLIAKDTWLRRFHILRPMVWLGKRSYSMYLVHVLCLNVFEARISINSGWKAAAVLAASYALTALVAEALYHTVESPARRFGRSWLERRGEVAVAI